MSQISSKSVQQLKRRNRKCVYLRLLIKIMNIYHRDVI